MESVSLKCPKCHKSFRVMEDEQFDHACPHCGFPNQPEHAGIDYFGNEILVGDHIVITPDGESVLEDSFEDYLIEVLGFEFKTAE